jgi:Zn-dependent protease
MRALRIETLLPTLLAVVLVMFSAILHEIAHGWVAFRLGDPTAKRAGRLTLDPRAHLDPFGSVALPIMMALAGGPMFAFAKPVPYNPRNLRHPVRDEVLVAFAGPLCNIVQALVGTLVLYGIEAFLRTDVVTVDYQLVYVIGTVLSTYVYVNLILAFFNLIPLPPLDGSSIIFPFLTGKARQTYYRIQAYALPILLIALYLVPMLTRLDPIGAYLDMTAGRLFDFLMSF